MNIKYDTTSPSCLVWLKGRRAGAVADTKKSKGYWEVICKWVQEKRLEHHKDFSPAQMYT